MSRPIISVENLGKKYRINHQAERQRYTALRDVIADKAKRLFRPRPSEDPRTEEFWALKDVSFEVNQGDVVGIIGRNGAGKSTLLKILSRITEPTTGRVHLRGRVASLLEVGTGFHPELTGRENIYLNGAILGMTRTEIRSKFDEIVAFAEVEKFLDTPVKRYSSGMYVRLAFAVAAHLEPEILVIDEVLAVGDAQFRKKCLGKIGDSAKEGRTVVFVSHQMNQIRRLCGKCAWLEDGTLGRFGQTPDVAASYETGSLSDPEPAAPRRLISRKAHFVAWEVVEPRTECHNRLDTIGPATIRFTLNVAKNLIHAHQGVALQDSEGNRIWSTDARGLALQAGTYEFLYTLSGLPLRPNAYSWRLSLHDTGGLIDFWECQPDLIIAAPSVTHSSDEWAGLLNIPYELRIERRGPPKTRNTSPNIQCRNGQR